MYDDQQLRAALRGANLPCLVMSLYQLTGDEAWLRPPFRPRRPRGIDDDDTGGFDEAVQDQVRTAAYEAIQRHSAGEPAAVAAPRGDLLVQLMSACIGEEVPAHFAEMTAVEMGFVDRQPTLEDRRLGQPSPRVAVVGAGIGGLTCALTLKQGGIPFDVYERNADVGGVWFTNRYPGAGVDTPSFLYSSAAYPRSWSAHFAKRDEVLGYLRGLSDHHDLRKSVRFNTAVERCLWDETTATWTLTVRGPDGESREERAAFVISAVGLFGEPNIPPIAGMDRFDGPVFHSTEWPEDLDVTGKRIAIVGTGASAMQIVPTIYDRAGAVGVFQRSPSWIAPAEKYFLPVTEDVHTAMDVIPFYRGWYRFRVSWVYGDKRYSLLKLDPEWDGHPNAINRRSDRLRVFLSRYIADQLAGRPNLIDEVTPDYPPYAKRMLLDNGWYRALCAPNVTLFSEPVAGLDGPTVRTASGREWEADVVVLCTGFTTTRYVRSMEVLGVGGQSLRDAWRDDDPRAYLGLMTAGFPNLFFIYGPNTNSGGGSFFDLAESQAHYIVSLVCDLDRKSARSVEPTHEALDRYSRALDDAHDQMIWSHPGLRSYYRNSAGRVVTNMPWRGVDYWNQVSQPDFADLALDGQERPA